MQPFSNSDPKIPEGEKAVTRSTTPIAAILAGLLTFQAVETARGQDPIIDGKPQGALRSFILTDHWGQWRLAVKNPHAQARRVRVICEGGSKAAGQSTSYERTVRGPPGAVRRVTLAYRPAPLPDAARPMGRFKGSTMTYRLADADSGRQLSTIGYQVQQLSGRSLRVVYLHTPGDNEDRRFQQSDFLGKLKDNQLGDANVISLGVSPINRPPDRWYGYEPIDVVVLGRFAVERVQPDHLQALLHWVRRGGVLVIVGSDVMEEMLLGPLGQAAGATVAGRHRTDRLEVRRPDGRALDAPVELPWPAGFCELIPTGAEVRWRANGLPLTTRHACGRGTVFTSAVSLGALADASLHDIWTDVRRAARSLGAVNPDAFEQAAGETLKSIVGRKAPGRLVPVGMLVALAALTVVLGGGLWAVRRGERTWLILTPVCLLTSVGIYAWTLQRDDPERLSYIGLISGTGGGRARVQAHAAYYSGPTGKEITLTADSPFGVMHQVDSDSQALSLLRIDTARTIRIEGRTLPRISFQGAYLDAMETVGGLEASLTFDERGLAGEIRNAFDAPLAQPVLLSDGRTFRLPGIDAGASANVSLDADDLLRRVEFVRPERRRASGARIEPYAVGEFTGSITHTQNDRLRNALLGRLTSVPSLGHPVGTEPVLIGYLEACPLRPVENRDPARQGWSVLTWPIRFRAPPAGSRVRIPAGFTRVDLEDRASSIWNPLHRRFEPSPRPGKLIASIRPPEPLSMPADTSLELEIGIRAVGYRLEVLGLPADWGEFDNDNAVSLGEPFVNPNGTVSLTVQDADRFAHPAKGIRLLLRTESIAPPSSEPVARGGQIGRSWTFETIDVTLEGRHP